MRRWAAFLLALGLAWPAWADMFPDASNAKLPEAVNNLGVGPASTPLFSGLNLSASTLTPTLKDEPGTLVSGYAWPVKRWSMYIGSDGNPVTTAGPGASLSMTGNVPTSQCGNNAAAVGCNPTLMVSTKGLATQGMVTSGITTFATGSSTVSGSDVQALNAISDITGSGTGVAMGAFIFGSRHTTTGLARGAEISAGNYTATNCALAYTFSGQCDGIFLASRGTGPATQLSAALHVGTDGNSLWREGVSFNPNSVKDTTILDQSSSTESVVIAGGHTTALRTTPGSGNVGFGVFTAPTARLQIAGNTSAAAWAGAGIGLSYNDTNFTDTTSSGTVALNTVHRFGVPTLIATNPTTYTTVTGLLVAAPVASTNVTITNNWAAQFAGNVKATGPVVNLSGLTTGTNANTVCMAAGGNLLIQAAACTISSLRFKRDVEPYKADALAKVARLDPITFRMKDADAPNPDANYDRPQIGLSAENVAAIEPRCAIYEDDGVTPKSYRQECLIAVLVSAVRQQQHDIDILKAR